MMSVVSDRLSEPSSRCTICMEDSTFLIAVKPCNHTFHLSCLQGLTKYECPNCRSDISAFFRVNDIKINESKESYEHEITNQPLNMSNVIIPYIPTILDVIHRNEQMIRQFYFNNPFYRPYYYNNRLFALIDSFM